MIAARTIQPANLVRQPLARLRLAAKQVLTFNVGWRGLSLRRPELSNGSTLEAYTPPPTVSPVKHGFTLIELLIAVAIMVVLASLSLSALQSVLEDAKESRTRAQIAKLNDLIMRRWEEFQSRPVPIKIVANTDPKDAAKQRLDALRELMRMELPDRQSDVGDEQVTLSSKPSLWRTYRRRAEASAGGTWTLTDHDMNSATSDIWILANWSTKFQGAECLYMIVAAIREGDGNGLDYFKPNEIGDLDDDGMPEILDGWGNPIEFLRWAPGFSSDIQITDATLSPDPFDYLQVDYALVERTNFNMPGNGYALHPLIMSAGRDKSFDIYGVVDFDSPDLPPFVQYSIATNAPLPPIGAGEPEERANSPYLALDSTSSSILNNPPLDLEVGYQFGSPADVDNSDGDDDLSTYQNNVDNITNHAIEVN